MESDQPFTCNVWPCTAKNPSLQIQTQDTSIGFYSFTSKNGQGVMNVLIMLSLHLPAVNTTTVQMKIECLPKITSQR